MVELLIFCSTIYFFAFVTVDPDLWGHIKFGEALFKAKSLPRIDLYSFTAYGHHWINHEWLAELIFYLAYHFLGDAGLLFGRLFIGLFIIALLCKICRMRFQITLVYAPLMLLGVVLISPGFMIRPQVFSFLFFTSYLYILHLYLLKHKNFLYLPPFLMLFWVNMHGGFLMGWVLIGGVTFWQTFLRLARGRSDVPLRPLWITLFAIIGASFVNPYGYKLFVFLYQTLSLDRQITEWRPIHLWDSSYIRFKVMALLFFLTTILNLKQKNPIEWEAPIIVLLFYAAVRHQRHTPFFAIVAAPYLVAQISNWAKKWESKSSPFVLRPKTRNLLAVLVGILAVYQMGIATNRHILTKCRIIVDPDEYPISAVRFLKTNQIAGHILLPFDWGEYVIWKLYPACRVSIDGRFRTVYPEDVINDHFHGRDINGWNNLINKYAADIILARQSIFFHKFIHNNANWVYVYSDKTAIIFIKDSVKNKAIIAKFKSGGFEYPKTEISVYFP